MQNLVNVKCGKTVCGAKNSCDPYILVLPSGDMCLNRLFVTEHLDCRMVLSWDL
jgi:hypothetical protein